MKMCTYCGDERPLYEFLPHDTSADGLGYFCKSCRTIKARAYKAHGSVVGTSFKHLNINRLLSIKKEIELELKFREELTNYN